MALYCVAVDRELEETCVLHYNFDAPPSRQQVLEKILEEDLNYDDNYGKFSYWPVTTEKGA
jgi:hypothetical protein